ncbi:MAG: TolC family protein [Bdellovibrionota bacterium]
MKIVLLVSGLLLSQFAHAAATEDFFSDLELFKARAPLLRTENERLNAESVNRISKILQITPTVSAAIGKTESRVKSDTTGSAKTIYDYWGVSAGLNLFRGFGDFQAWRAADNSVEAQRYQVKSEELKIELDGAHVIFNRLYLRDVKSAQDELLKLKQETMRIGRDRYRQGKIPLQDVEKMEVDLSQQQNIVRQAEIDLAQNEAAYKAFFVDELRTVKWPFAESYSPAIKGAEGAPASKSLRFRAAALEHSWKAARARYLPSLDLSVGYKEFSIKSPNAGNWTGTLELSIPLWNRYETATASALSYVAFVEAEGAAEIAEREEILKREFLTKKMELTNANYREARINQDKSDKVYRDMLRSFQLGRLSTNDLFQEQNRKIQSLLSYVQARFGFHESLTEACALWGLSVRGCLL